MKVVIVASEAVPFAKTGGLADVAGSLPPALEQLGTHANLIVPLYNRARKAGLELTDTGVDLRVPMGPNTVQGRVLTARLPGSRVAVYLIDQPAYFERDGLYGRDGVDYHDNCERFIFFSRAALETVRLLDLRPDVLHCNDWQTALIPVYLDQFYRSTPGFARLGTLMTIHNLAYQGMFWHWDLPLTGLDWNLFHWNGLEYHGKLNFLKAGIVYADMLTTVSPTYAKEIQTPAFGVGLDGLLRSRADRLRGIVNGIDGAVWNPKTDPQIHCSFDVDTFAERKPNCKALLQRRSGLPERPDVPLLAQIGRLDAQKGWDLIAGAADRILRHDVQLIVLGTGHTQYMDLLGRLADRYRGKVRAFFEFSDSIAHQIEAGADLFLMPSLYEPCGLNQLYSLAYGTVPLVRATGGLADTVTNTERHTLEAGTATGFSFQDATADALAGTVDYALGFWPDRPVWQSIQRTGMRQDWSWKHSAAEYLRVYEEIQRGRAS
jgi:starch synthase